MTFRPGKMLRCMSHSTSAGESLLAFSKWIKRIQPIHIIENEAGK